MFQSMWNLVKNLKQKSETAHTEYQKEEIAARESTLNKIENEGLLSGTVWYPAEVSRNLLVLSADLDDMPEEIKDMMEYNSSVYFVPRYRVHFWSDGEEIRLYASMDKQGLKELQKFGVKCTLADTSDITEYIDYLEDIIREHVQKLELIESLYVDYTK